MSRGQHIVILYVVKLLYGEQKGSLPGKLAHLNGLKINAFASWFSASINRISANIFTRNASKISVIE